MKKGFTLIELLAVIIILAVIALITIPMIGNIIEDSKKKALETSVYGIVEAANYFAISNDGIYKFVFKGEVQGKTEEGDYSLDYKGNVDATGELYIDNDGNISLCLMNDTYYVYKNYNSGIYIGNISDDTCIVGYDAITNRYVAMLDDGSGTVSNVYSKEEVDNLVTNLQSQISSNDTDIEALNTLISENKTQITTNITNITNIQNNLENYALQSELDKVNNNLSNINTQVSANTGDITSLQTTMVDLSTNIPMIYQSSTGTFSAPVMFVINAINAKPDSEGVLYVDLPTLPDGWRYVEYYCYVQSHMIGIGVTGRVDVANNRLVINAYNTSDKTPFTSTTVFKYILPVIRG